MTSQCHVFNSDLQMGVTLSIACKLPRSAMAIIDGRETTIGGAMGAANDEIMVAGGG